MHAEAPTTARRPPSGVPLRDERLLLPALVLLALLMRVAPIFLARTYQFADDWQMGYELGAIARNLADGRGFALSGGPTTWMPPLYPLILAPIFVAFGPHSQTSAAIILVLQSVVSSLLLVPLYRLTSRLVDTRGAALACLLWAISPGAIYYSAYFIWSSSFTAIGLLLTLVGLYAVRDAKKGATAAVLCGMLAGLTALSDPQVLTFIPLALLWVARTRARRGREAYAAALLIAASMCLMLAPWIIRNYVVFDRFIPVKGTFGVQLWLGNRPSVRQETAGLVTWDALAVDLDQEEFARMRAADEVRLNEMLLPKAVAFIVEHPGQLATNTAARVWLFWSVVQIPEMPVRRAWYLAFNALAAGGALLCLRRWRDLAPLLLLLLAFPLPHYLATADLHRYRVPLEPVMAICAALAIGRCLAVLGAWRGRAEETSRCSSEPQIGGASGFRTGGSTA